jgi:hypothetical protein
LPFASLIVTGDGPPFVQPMLAKAAATRRPCAGLLARVSGQFVQALVTWTVAPWTWLNRCPKSSVE